MATDTRFDRPSGAAVSARLPKDLLRRLERASNAISLSRSEYIRWAVEAAVDRDLYPTEEPSP